MHERDSSSRLYAHSLFCLTRRARSVGGRRTTSQNMYVVAADNAYLAVLISSDLTVAAFRPLSLQVSKAGRGGAHTGWSLTT